MIKGQLLVYHFNGLHNAKPNVDRDLFRLEDVDVSNSTSFRSAIEDALDEVPPGVGYVLVKWSGRVFICEKDSNDLEKDYVRHEIKWHPLLDKFTI